MVFGLVVGNKGSHGCVLLCSSSSVVTGVLDSGGVGGWTQKTVIIWGGLSLSLCVCGCACVFVV